MRTLWTWAVVGLLVVLLAGCDKKKKHHKEDTGTAEASFTCKDLLDRELAIYKGDPTTPEPALRDAILLDSSPDQRAFVITQCEQLSKGAQAAFKVCQDRASTFNDVQECNKLKLLENKPSDAKVKAVPRECAPACRQLVDHMMTWSEELDVFATGRHDARVEVRAVRKCLSTCIEKGPPKNWRECVKTKTFEAFQKCTSAN